MCSIKVLLFFFMWGQFDIYWYIGMSVGGGGGYVLHSHSRGVDRGSFLPSPTPFLLSPTPLLPSPTPCFLSHSLALLLSPSNRHLSPTPSLLSHIPSLLSPISSLLSPTPTSPLLPQPCPPLHSCKKSVCANRPRETVFVCVCVFLFFFANSPVSL